MFAVWGGQGQTARVGEGNGRSRRGSVGLVAMMEAMEADRGLGGDLVVARRRCPLDVVSQAWGELSRGVGEDAARDAVEEVDEGESAQGMTYATRIACRRRRRDDGLEREPGMGTMQGTNVWRRAEERGGLPRLAAQAEVRRRLLEEEGDDEGGRRAGVVQDRRMLAWRHNPWGAAGHLALDALEAVGRTALLSADGGIDEEDDCCDEGSAEGGAQRITLEGWAMGVGEGDNAADR